MPKLAISAEKLIKIFKDEFSKEEADPDVSKIKVNNVIGKLAFFYEKIRNMVDYREEHLLRKHAILRFLKRNVFFSDALMMEMDTLKKAKLLIHELIRAKYVANESLPENKIKKISVIIDKYLLLRLKYLRGKHKRNDKKITGWLLSVAACEIEREIDPAVLDRALAGCMYEIMKRQVVIMDNKISDADKQILIYIALHRALLKYDYDLISFLVLRLYWPDWIKDPDEQKIEIVAKGLDKLIDFIDRRINHSLSHKLLKLSSKYSVFFLVLRDVLIDNKDRVDEILENRKLLSDEVKKVCDRKYKSARMRLYRSAVNSIIYIFITKMALALVLEMPYDLYVLKSFRYLSLIINIAFPPLLMLLVVSFIRVPGENNTALITQGIMALLYSENDNKKIKVKRTVKRGSFFSNLFVLLYLATFLISFGIIYKLLHKLNFSIFSMLLFFFFLCLISFFGVRIRNSAKEMVVIRKKDNFISVLVDFFTLPFLTAGRWLSFNLSKINVFVFIFDFIIEAPFQTFIEIMEDWFAFLREKKEELY